MDEPAIVLLTGRRRLRARLIQLVQAHGSRARKHGPSGWRETLDGPATVAAGLARGLAEMGVDTATDRARPRAQSTVVGVLSGVREAHRAAEWRRAGRIRRFALGPNVALLPSSEPTCGWDVADVVVVPCEWVASLYEMDLPSLTGRVAVWPAGIDTGWWTPGPRGRDRVLVYDKRLDGSAEDLAVLLRGLGLAVTVLRYGTYSPERYRSELRASKALVWLGRTESQGLAMFEAWSCDVPTVVVGRPALTRFGDHEVMAHPAPYLTRDRGRLVEELDAVPAALAAVIGGTDTAPRASMLDEFSLVASATAYLEIASGVAH